MLVPYHQACIYWIILIYVSSIHAYRSQILYVWYFRVVDDMISHITSEFTTLAQFSSLHQGYQGAISSTRRSLCRWFLVDSHQAKHHLTAGHITGSLHNSATSYVLPFGVSLEPTLTNMFEKVWQKLWKAKCLFFRMLQSFAHGQRQNFISATSNTFWIQNDQYK